MSTSDYRMLVLDCDGTALTRGGGLLPEDVAAAARLRALGVHITIATGRLFPGTDWIARAFGVTGSVAVMNGSELVDAQSGRVQQGWYVDPAGRHATRSVFGDVGLDAFLFSSRTIHHDSRHARHAPYLRIWSDHLTEHPDILGADAWHRSDDVLAICGVGDEVQVREARDALERSLPDELGVVEFPTFDGERFLEVRQRSQDKASALRALAAAQGVDVAQVVAVGDWINDLSMLRAAGLGLAMGGSEDQVLAAADGELSAQRGQGGAVKAVAELVWGV